LGIGIPVSHFPTWEWEWTTCNLGKEMGIVSREWEWANVAKFPYRTEWEFDLGMERGWG